MQQSAKSKRPRQRSQPQKPNPAEAIFRETRATHEDVRKLHPLLELLEPQSDEESEDPLAGIKALLEQILLAIHHQQQAIESLEAHVVAIREGRRLGKSSGVQQ